MMYMYVLPVVYLYLYLYVYLYLYCICICMCTCICIVLYCIVLYCIVLYCIHCYQALGEEGGKMGEEKASAATSIMEGQGAKVFKRMQSIHENSTSC
jgi:hypothetical protein